MRILLFFDLPTISDNDRREYRRFHKQLIKNGFVPMQESVYTKIALNQTAVKIIMDRLYKLKLEAGLVQIITITEKQFADMRYLVGERISPYIDDDRKLVILEDNDEAGT